MSDDKPNPAANLEACWSSLRTVALLVAGVNMGLLQGLDMHSKVQQLPMLSSSVFYSPTAGTDC